MITTRRLKERLEYNPVTGIFTWKVRPCRNVMAGDKAGTLHPTGYLKIVIDKRAYNAHRLAWFYMTGEWPEFAIDHINGIKHDNRIDNLRKANWSENAMNRKTDKRSQSKIKNIRICKCNQNGNAHYSWQVQICANGRKVSKSFSHNKYGYDNALRLAIEWRDKTLEELHGTFMSFVIKK